MYSIIVSIKLSLLYALSYVPLFSNYTAITCLFVIFITQLFAFLLTLLLAETLKTVGSIFTTAIFKLRIFFSHKTERIHTFSCPFLCTSDQCVIEMEHSMLFLIENSIVASLLFVQCVACCGILYTYYCW